MYVTPVSSHNFFRPSFISEVFLFSFADAFSLGATFTTYLCWDFLAMVVSRRLYFVKTAIGVERLWLASLVPTFTTKHWLRSSLCWEIAWSMSSIVAPGYTCTCLCLFSILNALPMSRTRESPKTWVIDSCSLETISGSMSTKSFSTENLFCV